MEPIFFVFLDFFKKFMFFLFLLIYIHKKKHSIGSIGFFINKINT